MANPLRRRSPIRKSGGCSFILESLGFEDDAGLAVWASRELVSRRDGFLGGFRQMTFLDFEPRCQAHWRVLEHAVQKMPSVRATLPFEADPARAEVYEAVTGTRDRLVSLGFEEMHADREIWRPAGLREAEDCLFREGAVVASGAGLAIRGAPQGDGTARVVAREARRILDQGNAPSDLLILFRQWTPQAELILEMLHAWGIPAWSEHRAPLDSNSAVAALRLAMRIPAEDWETDLLVRLLRHGQVHPDRHGADPSTLVGAASAIKESRVFRGGRALILNALNRAASEQNPKPLQRERAAASFELVEWFTGLLDRANRRRIWSAQVDQLLELAHQLGLDRLPPARLALDQLRDLLEERGEMNALLRRGEPERPLSWNEFAREVTRILDEAPLQGDSPPLTSHVRLATVDEVRGARAKFVFLADLSEGTFPARDAVEPFLAIKPGESPSATARIAYSREAIRFLGVLGVAELGVIFFYPTTDAKGQEILRAGFLDDLLASLTPEVERRCHESHVRFHPALLDQPDLTVPAADHRVRIVANARESGDLSELENLASVYEERLALQGTASALEVMQFRAYGTPFSEFDGKLRDGFAILDVGDRFNAEFLFSASQLETYIGCPFQFFAKYVLKLHVHDDRDELGEDFTERGSRIHGLLEELEKNRKDLENEMESERIERISLNKTLHEELANPTGVDLGLRVIEDRRIERVLKQYKVQLGDYERNSPSRPIPHFFELKFGQSTESKPQDIPYPPLQIGQGQSGVKLQGMIDRIDLVNTERGSAFRIIDYKSGKGPSAPQVKSGQMLQLPLYALAVERLVLADEDKTLLDVGYWELKQDGYKSIRFESWAEDQGMLEEHVIKVVEKLRQGVFPVNPGKDGCESYCEFRSICRVRQVRSAHKEPGDAIVPAIALSASALRAKRKAKETGPTANAERPESPGVVHARPLGDAPLGGDQG